MKRPRRVTVKPPMPLAMQVESEQQQLLADLKREAHGNIEAERGPISARERNRRYFEAASIRLRMADNARRAAKRFGGAA